MDYIIRKFDVEIGQLTVEYAGKWVYAVDLPIEDGAFPTGERLEEVIQSVAPVWLLQRQNALAQTPANAEVIQALVQPFSTPVISQEQDAAAREAVLESDRAFITDVVNAILTAKGL